jgi:hypothetical protein
MRHERLLWNRMFRTAYVFLVFTAAIALVSCGNDDGSKSSSAQTPPGAHPPSEGASGSTGKQDRSSSKRQSPGKADSPNGTTTKQNGSTAGADGGATIPDTGGATSGATLPRDRGTVKKSPKRNRVRPPRRIQDRRGLFSTRKVFRYGKLGCKSFGPEHIKQEWGAKSLKSTDVAQAYANAWASVAPLRTRKAMYRGCLAGLRQRREEEQKLKR